MGKRRNLLFWGFSDSGKEVGGDLIHHRGRWVFYQGGFLRSDLNFGGEERRGEKTRGSSHHEWKKSSPGMGRGFTTGLERENGAKLN